MANGKNLSSPPSPSPKKKRNGGNGRIEMRTQPGLKEAMVARSCNGFGTKGYGLSKMLRYAFLHMDDGSSIDLSEVENLIKTIGLNRLQLDKISIFYQDILDEVNRIGNNINQVARKVNLESLIAAEEGTPEYELGEKLLNLGTEIQYYQDTLIEKIEAFILSASEERGAVQKILYGEDELLTRCLVFPQAGEKQHQYNILIRKIKDYIDGKEDMYNSMSLGRFLFELKEKSEVNKK